MPRDSVDAPVACAAFLAVFVLMVSTHNALLRRVPRGVEGRRISILCISDSSIHVKIAVSRPRSRAMAFSSQSQEPDEGPYAQTTIA